MNKFGFLGLAMALATFASCDDDKNEHEHPRPGNISALAVETFEKMYPDARNVEWELKDAYAVAEFYQPSVTKSDDQNASAWFDNTYGDWAMTETDIPFNSIPEKVRASFAASEYADWRIDDVDLLLREGVELLYIIEVEQGERSMDLYYSEDGVLVKSMADASDNYDYSDFIPQKPQGNIQEWLAANYPNARIIDIDVEYQGTEIEILDNYRKRDILFDASSNWVYTKTEVRWQEVPSAVANAFRSSEYKDYYVDDIDFYQTDGSEYYRFDLESRGGDIKIDINVDGSISIATPGIGGNPGTGGNGNGGMVEGDVQSFIESQYPGARILERDYDDGYLEIEIWHENREKKVYFNGANSWVYTKSDCRYQDLPEAVLSAIRNSQYASYWIDDVEWIESPNSSWYLLELERGDREIKVRIDSNGTIL